MVYYFIALEWLSRELDACTRCHTTLLGAVDPHTVKLSIVLNEMVFRLLKKITAKQCGINIKVVLKDRIFLWLRLTMILKSMSWKN